MTPHSHRSAPDAHAAASHANMTQDLRFEPFDFDKTLVHGIKVYTKHLSFSPCIHMRIGFRYGAMHDDTGKEGTAHFLEHMIFDGSNIFEDEKATQEFGKTTLLDTLNAYTGMFELFITGKCLPHNMPKALGGIFSMILHPKLTEKSWEHEQKVITQEAWGKFLNEKRIAYIKKERANTMYEIPARLRMASAIGWPDTIMNITHEDIVHAHKKFFIKENMELYVSGNLDTVGGKEALISALETFLAQMPSGTKAEDIYIPKKIGAPKTARFDHTYEEVGLSPRQQTSITISGMHHRIEKKPAQPNAAKENKHIGALTLAGSLLSDLVFRKLRLEHSWCYGAGASAYATEDYLSLTIGGSIDQHHVDEANTILWKLIDDVILGEYKDDFEKTKQLVIDNMIAKERTTGNILDSAVESQGLHGEIPSLHEYLERIAAVTFDDVRSVVKDYLDRKTVFTEIVRPGAESAAGAPAVHDDIDESETDNDTEESE